MLRVDITADECRLLEDAMDALKSLGVRFADWDDVTGIELHLATDTAKYVIGYGESGDPALIGWEGR